MLILFLRGNWHTNKNIFCNHEVRDLPQASLAAAFAKIYVSLQAGLLVWLPSPALSPGTRRYAHKLTCSQAKIYPRKQCLCPGVSPQRE